MNRFVRLILIGALFILTASIVILSSVPPVSRDALTHHLAVPKLYLKHGGIFEIPHVVFSYFPMNIDLLYLIPLYFDNDIATKYIHFSFALLTAWLIFNYLYKRLDLFYALLGALFFLSLPLIVKLSITVYVDLGLVFFSTAAIIYFFKWIESRFKLKHLMISACWCGLALGTKYNGLVILFLLTLFVPFVYVRKRPAGGLNQAKAVGYAAIFMAVALLVFLPWMIRNYQWTQNPIYPLYHNWFSQQQIAAPADITNENDDNNGNTGTKLKAGSTRSQKQRIGLFGYRKIIYNESWWEIALVPLRIFFTGKDGDPQYFDGRLNPLLFILPFFAFILSPKAHSQSETEKWIWLVFSLLFLMITFFQVEMRIRYVAPIVPPLIILSMMGLHQIYVTVTARYPAGSSIIPRAVITAVAGMMLLINAFYIMHQFREVQPIAYLSGRVGRDEYIEARRKEYPAVQFANKNLPAAAKILSIFLGNRIYHSDKIMISDPNVFLGAVKKSDSPQEISIDLRKIGLTHLIIRMDLFESWIDNNFSEKKKELIKLFFKENMQLLYYKNGYGLYEVKE
ncbi:MAG: phospholipid carrier-dependent glycosyltransferase [Desulfobacterales bacterium]|nr:phospholipid carrier-dependent glycosyltransferase [Desulfobacterales bacterium]